MPAVAAAPQLAQIASQRLGVNASFTIITKTPLFANGFAQVRTNARRYPGPSRPWMGVLIR
jgi:hypothetical protein